MVLIRGKAHCRGLLLSNKNRMDDIHVWFMSRNGMKIRGYGWKLKLDAISFNNIIPDFYLFLKKFSLGS
jgi:hypothetical protein